jgi:hypothetical protein
MAASVRVIVPERLHASIGNDRITAELMSPEVIRYGSRYFRIESHDDGFEVEGVELSYSVIAEELTAEQGKAAREAYQQKRQAFYEDYLQEQ